MKYYLLSVMFLLRYGPNTSRKNTWFYVLHLEQKPNTQPILND